MIFEVLGRELRGVGAGGREVQVGVLAFLDHRHVLRVQLARRSDGGLDVLRRLDHGRADGHVLRKPDLRTWFGVRADRLHGEAVSEHRVVARLIETSRRQLESRGMDADPVPQLHEGAELVDGEDVLHAVGEPLRDVAGVGGERVRGVARLPAAPTVLERLRQVPVVQGGKRLDAVREQLVDQAVVEVEPLRVRGAVALREHPRPRDREAVGLHAQRLHQLHVFLVAVIVVVGDIAGGVVHDLAGRVRERVPDRRSSAVLLDRSLDLIRRRGCSPEKAAGECTRRGGPGARCRSPAAAVRLRRARARRRPRARRLRQPWQKHDG